jgi:hypothetical protein
MGKRAAEREKCRCRGCHQRLSDRSLCHLLSPRSSMWSTHAESG